MRNTLALTVATAALIAGWSSPGLSADLTINQIRGTQVVNGELTASATARVQQANPVISLSQRGMGHDIGLDLQSGGGATSIAQRNSANTARVRTATGANNAQVSISQNGVDNRTSIQANDTALAPGAAGIIQSGNTNIATVQSAGTATGRLVGTIVQTGDRNTGAIQATGLVQTFDADIRQTGSDHKASVASTGSGSIVRVTQGQGNLNDATVRVHAPQATDLTIIQQGSRNRADLGVSSETPDRVMLSMTGNDNSIGLDIQNQESGATANSADLRILGDRNHIGGNCTTSGCAAPATMIGSGLSMRVRIGEDDKGANLQPILNRAAAPSNGNAVGLWQNGLNLTSQAVIIGQDNLVQINQTGADHRALVAVAGDRNTVRANQTGTPATLTLKVTGDDNVVTSSQQGSALYTGGVSQALGIDGHNQRIVSQTNSLGETSISVNTNNIAIPSVQRNIIAPNNITGIAPALAPR